MSSTKRLAHQVSATPPSPHASALAHAARHASFALGMSSSSSSSSSDDNDRPAAATSATATTTTSTSKPKARRVMIAAPQPSASGMPRTTEVLWDGAASLGFTLKRKRKTGAILVSKLQASCASRLLVGSELKLVGGFPVRQLTLDEVKKVMLRAPKPVSLVFLNHEDAAREARGSFALEPAFEPAFEPSARARGAFFDSAPGRPALQRTASDFTLTAPVGRAPASPSAASTSSALTAGASYYAKPTDSQLKKRKVSKLRVALDRMGQLLNRPVRQSALNIPADKSIVV